MNNVRRPGPGLVRGDRNDKRKTARAKGYGLALGIVGIAFLALGVAFTALGTPARPAGMPAEAGSASAEPTRTPAAADTEPIGSGAAVEGPGFALSFNVERADSPSGPVYVFVLGVMAGDEAVSIPFASGRQYDFVIHQDGREVWRASADRAFHQAFHALHIEPRALASFVHVWDGRDREGNPVIGEVVAEAWLTSTTPRRAGATTMHLRGR